MSAINHFIANAAGELTKLIPLIEDSLKVTLPMIESELNAKNIDIIFVSAASLTIPEYGIGGNSPGPNHIYISFDPNSDKITQQGLNETLLHEAHHCMRWRNPGYDETLGEAMVSEGLACLYEQEYSGQIPIYAKVPLLKEQVNLAKEEMSSKTYDHSKWFYGSDKIVRWFGYTYGYQLCERYSRDKKLDAKSLVHVPASEILNYTI